MPSTHYAGSRGQLMARLRELPQLLSGRIPDPGDGIGSLMGALGLQALTLIKEAYLIKARGGTDASGLNWPPLSPRTIAYGRRHPGLMARRNRAAKAGRSRRPLLTAAQDKLWRQIYARQLRKKDTNAGRAAAVAWTVVKRAGGKTIIDTYGQTSVEIGRDTGRLFNSLSPGSHPAPTNADQIFRVEPGSVTVGTNVEYARHFARRRPLWPDGDGIPDVWWRALGDTLNDGLALLLHRRLG